MIRDTRTASPPPRVEGIIRSPHRRHRGGKADQPGQLLQAGTTPVFTVADLSKVWVMAHIFDTDLGVGASGRHRPGEPGAGSTLSGTVDNIAAEVDPNTRSVAVRIVVDNPGDFLKRQMYVAGADRRPPADAAECWFRSRPSCATTKICPSSMSSRRTAALPARM